MNGICIASVWPLHLASLGLSTARWVEGITGQLHSPKEKSRPLGGQAQNRTVSLLPPPAVDLSVCVLSGKSAGRRQNTQVQNTQP